MNPSDTQRDRTILADLVAIRRQLDHFISLAIPNRTDKEDLLQEVIIKVWEMRDNYEDGTNFRAWVFSIAKFTIMDWRKRYATRRQHCLDNQTIECILADAQNSIGESDSEALRQSALEHCIGQLDHRSKQLLQCYYRDNLSIPKIAERDSVTSSSIKQLLYRIRVKLRKCIEQRINFRLLTPLERHEFE